eukprot:gb/GFBE01057180.1/.p1 GENE.gb/GFBE01057180.1/~~gb/GFBE01057180.1/.p1  ORF type:complete len:385 (+),score=54.67 gb/GFBE01057180.1/:1-1155(+)
MMALRLMIALVAAAAAAGTAKDPKKVAMAIQADGVTGDRLVAENRLMRSESAIEQDGSQDEVFLAEKRLMRSEMELEEDGLQGAFFFPAKNGSEHRVWPWYFVPGEWHKWEPNQADSQWARGAGKNDDDHLWDRRDNRPPGTPLVASGQDKIPFDVSLRGFQGLFRIIDVDRGGWISLNEFTDMIQDAGLDFCFPPGTVRSESSFNLLDKDGSGRINRHEFVQGCFHYGGHKMEDDNVACKQWVTHVGWYAPGHADDPNQTFSLEDAKLKCHELGFRICEAVTCPANGMCSLRASHELFKSTWFETTYVPKCLEAMDGEHAIVACGHKTVTQGCPVTNSADDCESRYITGTNRATGKEETRACSFNMLTHKCEWRGVLCKSTLD